MPSRLIGGQDSPSSTIFGFCAAYLLTALLSIFISTTPASAALLTVPGSPCADLCSADELSYANNTVCLDDSFQNGAGKPYRECTTCLLNSTAVDATQNVSDVYWGLFNLRYTLSECMFAYPAEIVSISSPCQVTCQPLQPAITYGISPNVSTATDNVMPNFDFCNDNFFGDFKVNNCTFCYTYIPQQLYLGNFMQALHIACRQPPAIGATFYPDGRAIFNESAIPGPAPVSSGNNGGHGLAGWKLGLAIALPVVGGAILFGATCFCCFKFTKKRRQRMALSGRMSTYHDRHTPTSTFVSPVSGRTPPSQYEWPIPAEPAREMERISVLHTPKGLNSKQPSPGLAQGRWSRHEDDDEVPMSPVVDNVGPAPGQAKDPFLHEQYFGVASSGVSGENVAGPSAYIPPGERGSWVR